MQKVLGYVLMLLGIGLIFLRVTNNAILEKLPFLIEMDLIIFYVLMFIAIIIGFWFSKNKRILLNTDVPVYSGNRIIGYRRK